MRRRTFDVSRRDFSTVTRVPYPRTYALNGINDTVEWLSRSKASRTTKQRENRRFCTTVYVRTRFGPNARATERKTHPSRHAKPGVTSYAFGVDFFFASSYGRRTMAGRANNTSDTVLREDIMTNCSFSNNSVSISSWHTSFGEQWWRYTRVTGAKRLGAMTSQSSFTTVNGVKAQGYRVDRTRSIDKRTI